MDISYLYQQGPYVKLPDPEDRLRKRLVLAQLADQNAMRELALEEARRKYSANDEFSQLYPALLQGGFSDQAMAQAAGKAKYAAPLLEQAREKYMEQKGKQAKNDAEVYKDKTAKQLEMTADMAGGLAEQVRAGRATDQWVSSFMGKIVDQGLDKHLPAIPFQQWTDRNAVADYLELISNSFYKTSDRIRNAETGRHNLATEGETRRHNTTTEGMQAGNYASEDWARKQTAARGWASLDVEKQRATQEALGQPVEVLVDGKPAMASFNRKGGGWYDPATGTRIGGNVQPKMSDTLKKDIAQNNATISNIDRAIAGIEERPGTLGLKNAASVPFTPLDADAIAQMRDPSGAGLRAIVAGIGGQKLHDLSGAAVALQEATRLLPMIPRVSDRPAVAIEKLKNLRRELVLMQQELSEGRSIGEVVNRQPTSGRSASGSITGPIQYQDITITPGGR